MRDAFQDAAADANRSDNATEFCKYLLSPECSDVF
jgi:hypothetical protein